MLIDFRDASAQRAYQADVCVIGAGAAGITVARNLAARGIHVCLLEAGGADFDAGTQALYDGSNLGMEYYPLEESRLRFLGGTTNIWGGRSVPLDEIDFQERSWVPHSGWPISRPELESYYRQAHDDLELGAYAYDEGLWEQTRSRPPAFLPETFSTTFWRFDNRHERYGASSTADLVESQHITLLLGANAVHIQAAANATGVESIRIANLTGVTGEVRAKQFVLACGAIENARMLLSSDDVQAGGLGNTTDQVGRYFMEHPHGRLGTVKTDQAFTIWSAYRKRFPAKTAPFAPALVMTPALQEKLAVLNSAVTFKLQRDARHGAPLNKKLYLKLKHDLQPTRSSRRLWYAYRHTRNWLQRNVRRQLERARVSLGLTGLHIIVRAEQAPNPLSRVVLSEQRDPLGVRKADLNWQLGELDKRTVSIMAKALAQEYQRLGIGEVVPAQWLADETLEWPIDPTVSNHPIGGYHHMGTTRMASGPTEGVVDSNCRVFGLDNLFVAGSSVFSTGGWGNPTLTLIALAHRLADHLHAAADR